jgi:hypothetical protein
MYATILTVVLVVGQVWHDRSGWEVRPKEIVVAHAKAVWTNGAADGDWDVVGNWSGGVVPVNGANTYDVVFDPAQTTTPPTVNLAQAADEVNSITFLPGWTAGIGSSGTPLEIMIDSDSAPVSGDLFRGLTVQGSGDYYYKCPVAGSANVIRDAAPNRGVLYLDGDIENLIVRGGSVEVMSSATLVDSAYVFGNASYLNLAAGATLGDLKLFVAGGRVDLRGDLAASSEVHISAGTVTSHGAVRTLFYLWGGVLALQQKDTLFVSDYFCFGGIITFEGSVYTPDLNSWVIGPGGHIIWHPDFWTDPGQTGALCVDLREQQP